MGGHIAGKRHTRAVARRFYVLSRRTGTEPMPPLNAEVQNGRNANPEAKDETGSLGPDGTALQSNSKVEQVECTAREQRTRLFEEHSSKPLRRNGWAEAPDIALVLLHAALDKTTCQVNSRDKL